MDSMKTNTGLVEYARAQLGLPYWYGTYGQTASASLFAQKQKQYPNYYTASDFPSQYGKRVHDCVGLIKGYLWSDTSTGMPKYNKDEDHGVSGFKALCAEKGGMAALPELPGALVFKGSDHVGIYEGGGYVLEAKGHAYGVIRSPIAATPWTDWGKCPWITYDAGADSVVDAPSLVPELPAPSVEPPLPALDFSNVDVQKAIAAAEAFLEAVGARKG
jgi:cell wall-associated NlpC family hydrolase